jgi:hypothetical protein
MKYTVDQQLSVALGLLVKATEHLNAMANLPRGYVMTEGDIGATRELVNFIATASGIMGGIIEPDDSSSVDDQPIVPKSRIVFPPDPIQGDGASGKN